MRRLALGDVHGSYKALMDVLEKASFSDEDELFFVGDVADGYPDVFECLHFFLGLKKFRPVIGNHDIWLQNYLSARESSTAWLNQGGWHTVKSVGKAGKREMLMLAEYLASWPYVIDTGREFIMHGGPAGFSQDELLLIGGIRRHTYEKQEFGSAGFDIVWDRTYLMNHLQGEERSIAKRVVIGHTPVGSKPYVSDDGLLVALDTGCGWDGRLTLFDLDTGRSWQSGQSEKFYPGHNPRGIC